MKWSLSSDSRIYPLFLSESRVLQPSLTFHPSLELAPTHDRVFSARNIHTFILQVLFIHSSNRYYSSFHSSILQPEYTIHSFFFHETCPIHSLLLQVLFIISFIHSSYILHTPSYSLHTPFIHFFFWNMHYSFIPPTGTFHLSSFLSSFHSFINLTACIYHSFIYFFMKHALFIQSIALHSFFTLRVLFSNSLQKKSFSHLFNHSK